MEDRILGFINYLRRAGLPISVSETIDCFEALTHISIADKEWFKTALSITLVKDSVNLPVFDELFDLYFFGAAAESAKHFDPDQHPPEDDIIAPQEFIDQLEAAIDTQDMVSLTQLAEVANEVVREAVESGIIPGNLPVISGGGMTSGELMQRINTLRLLRQEDASAEPIRTYEGLEGWLGQHEQEQMLHQFHQALDNHLRRRELNQQGLGVIERRIPNINAEEVDINNATYSQLSEMERAIKPLAKRLSSRIAHKRKRDRQGKVDIRSTLRRSLDTGGVPIDLRLRRPRPSKPELYLLCDISISTTGFSAFALQLVYSIQSLFTKVRSFAFVDAADEITDFLNTNDFAEGLNRVNREAQVVEGDGRSDYGKALIDFYKKYSDKISSNSHLIIIGDARNNRRPHQAWVLRELKGQVRKIYWLNPEPGFQWNTGDSVMDEYAKFCHGVYECRNLSQLAQVIPKLS